LSDRFAELEEERNQRALSAFHELAGVGFAAGIAGSIASYYSFELNPTMYYLHIIIGVEPAIQYPEINSSITLASVIALITRMLYGKRNAFFYFFLPFVTYGTFILAANAAMVTYLVLRSRSWGTIYNTAPGFVGGFVGALGMSTYLALVFRGSRPSKGIAHAIVLVAMGCGVVSAVSCAFAGVTQQHTIISTQPELSPFLLIIASWQWALIMAFPMFLNQTGFSVLRNRWLAFSLLGALLFGTAVAAAQLNSILS
jgi:hypothetical protein